MNYPLKIGQPRFLSLDEVQTLHRVSLDAYGGADGVLDQGKLESSLAMPRQGFGTDYAHEFPFGMAAAYGFHLAMNHAFRDGNKRTAFAAMVVFLRMNGWNFEMPDEEAAAMMLEMIEQRREKAWLAGQIQRCVRVRASFELRDFFAALSPERSQHMLESLRTGPLSEMATTVEEATAAVPLVLPLLLWSEKHRESNDNEGMINAAAQANMLIFLFRIAEDMGYEW